MCSEICKVLWDEKSVKVIVEEIYDSIIEGNSYKVLVSKDEDTNKYDVLLKSEDHCVILYKELLEIKVADQYVKSIYDFLNE